MSDALREVPGQSAPAHGNADLSRLVDVAECSPDEALDRLQSSPTGLSRDEVTARQKRFGLNLVSHERPPTWHRQLFEAFLTPFNGVLGAVAIVSAFTDVVFAAPEDRSYATIVIVLSMLLLSTLLRFWQEFTSRRAAERLKAMVRSTAAVIRGSAEQPREVPIADIVPGDVIQLSAGDIVPADARVLWAKDLFVSEAMLTGESIPVEKSAAAPPKPAPTGARGPPGFSTICFMGSNVVSGTATAVAAVTGNATYFGAIAKDIAAARPLTSFDIGISQVSWTLVRFILVLTPLVFVINGLTKGDWVVSLLFAASVAVGLTPEMLPMIVTANLAKGALVMARRKAIVKRLNSIQNFGAMDILCADKTGTLTQNRVILERHLNIHGREDAQVLEYAALNSFYQTGLKNLLDVAVLEYSTLHGMGERLQHYHKVDELPFDFVRRRMSVVVRDLADPRRQLLICKGAIEELLPLCSCAGDSTGSPSPAIAFTPEQRQEVRAVTRRLNGEGLRALAVAYKPLPPEDRAYTAADETDLILSGYVAFLDPPKESARTAITALSDHGVAIKIITGDNEPVTRKICREVGLAVAGVLSGEEVERLADEALARAAEATTIFVKMSPLQKSRVIRVLKKAGHTVGFLGDGINDAAALKDADVGISVDSAVDIAKESADIILLEKSLLVLEEAVVEGRRIFANIIKYIKMAASSNFGNVFSVLIASIALPFLPMRPIQLLAQNLLYDISQISIPWDDVDQDYLKKPRAWDASGIARFMVFIGPISSVFDVITFLVMWNVFGANSPERQSLFQSGWFVVGLLTQTLIVHMIRTKRIPFLQSHAAPPVILLTGVVMAIGIYLPFSPLGEHFGLVPLPPLFFAWLIAILVGYSVLTQLTKRVYIRRFGEWL